jgi:hypothetical protein
MGKPHVNWWRKTQKGNHSVVGVGVGVGMFRKWIPGIHSNIRNWSRILIVCVHWNITKDISSGVLQIQLCQGDWSLINGYGRGLWIIRSLWIVYTIEFSKAWSSFFKLLYPRTTGQVDVDGQSWKWRRVEKVCKYRSDGWCQRFMDINFPRKIWVGRLYHFEWVVYIKKNNDNTGDEIYYNIQLFHSILYKNLWMVFENIYGASF